MSVLTPALRTLIEGARLAHVVTVNPDGSPQVSCVWVCLDGDQVVFASLGPWRKIRNLARDPRISLSIEAETTNDNGMQEYAVLSGTATVEPGGAPELLQELAHAYLGPDVRYPPMEDPPEGSIVRITIEKVTGVGPW